LTITLTQAAAAALRKPNGSGGQQNLYVHLRQTLANDNLTIIPVTADVRQVEVLN